MSHNQNHNIYNDNIKSEINKRNKFEGLSAGTTMNWRTAYVSILIIVLVILPRHLIGPLPIGTIERSSSYPMDQRLNFTGLTARNGYLSEEHEVVTEDGYILTIHRIVQAKNCKGNKKQPPVILMHGLLMSSDSWIDAGPKGSLAYLLADACHDLWVGNQRGNYYSRRHKYLHPDEDAKFWKFSVDEIGLYDVPATIDYVLNYTGAEKVNFIGYSQGCGTFYIMCSERPGYCEKINLKISLAPATRHLNTKAVGFRKTCEYIEAFQDVLESSGVYEVLARGGPTQELLSSFCRFVTSSSNLCTKGIAIFDAFHPGSISTKTLQVLFDHFPAGTSVQNMARYGQSMRNVDFVKFDYGVSKNCKLYGNERPPAFNLSAVTIPVVVIYGKNDGIVDTADVKWLVNRLPNVLESFEVRDPYWTHADDSYSQFTSKMIFPKIVEYLEKYSCNDNSEYSYF